MLASSLIIIIIWNVISSALNTPFSSSIFFLTVIITLLVNEGYSSVMNNTCTSIIGEISTFSFFIIILSVWIIALIFLNSISYSYNLIFPVSFSLNIITLLFIILVFFYTSSLLTFYIMFELSLLPTLVLIINWGYQPERLQASFYFIIYTICASLPLLFSIIMFNNNFCTLSIEFQYPFCFICLSYSNFLIIISFTIPFLVNLPIWGVHLWLPNAHVEAPVSGSIILAGILLKLGGYGLIIIFPFYSSEYSFFIKFIISINLWSLIVISLVCLCSVDIKIIIAYSSVTHISIVILGLTSGSTVGLLGAILIIVVHGLNSSGLFSLINFNYEATNTRNMSLQNGIINMYPTISLFWFILLSSNMSAPPSLSLLSEIMICMSIINISIILSLFILIVTFFAAAYNIYLFSCQTGNTCNFINFSNNISSNIILSSFIHISPIYIGIFCSFYFYIWNNSSNQSI